MSDNMAHWVLSEPESDIPREPDCAVFSFMGVPEIDCTAAISVQRQSPVAVVIDKPTDGSGVAVDTVEVVGDVVSVRFVCSLCDVSCELVRPTQDSALTTATNMVVNIIGSACLGFKRDI